MRSRAGRERLRPPGLGLGSGKLSRGKAKWFFPVGVVAGLVGTLWFTRQPTEPLTRPGLSEARALWERAGPSDYVLELEVGGREDALHRVEVVDGQVVAMTTGGNPAPERVWSFWSVEGMFDSLATELGHAEEPQAAYGVRGQGSVRLRAAFDPELGLPRRFLRHVEGRPLDIDWTVRVFEAGF